MSVISVKLRFRTKQRRKQCKERVASICMIIYFDPDRIRVAKVIENSVENSLNGKYPVPYTI